MAKVPPENHRLTEGAPLNGTGASSRGFSAPGGDVDFRTLFETSSDAMLVLSGGRFMECNPAALALFRADCPEDILEKSPSELSPFLQPDGMPSAKKETELLQAARGSGSAAFEWLHFTKRGDPLSVEARLSLCGSGNGETCLVVLRDITRRKMKDRWIESLSSTLPGMLFQVKLDPSGEKRMVCFGGTLAPHFGFLPEHARIVREEFFRNISPGDLPRVIGTFDEAMENRCAWKCDFRLDLPQGGPFLRRGDHSADGGAGRQPPVARVSRGCDGAEGPRGTAEGPARAPGADLRHHPRAPCPQGSSFPVPPGQRGFRRFCEQARGEILGKGPYEVFGPELAELVFREDREILRTGETKMDLERRVQDGHGRLMWLKSCKGPIRNSRGEVVGIVGGNMDITAVKDAEEAPRESEARWKFALEGAGAGVWDLNVQSGDIFFSKQWKALLGYEDHEIRNCLEEWKRLIHPEDAEATFRQIELTHEENLDVCTAEFRMKRKDGEWAWILGMWKVVELDANGKPLRVIGTHTDITERKNAERIIFHQATHDALTDLANRSLFNDRLGMAMAEARRCRKKVGVIFLDLDNFKKVNDALGHSAGDLLLVSAAERMRRTLRDTDTLARIGGDEFAFLFPLVDERADMEAVADRILETLSVPFPIEGREFAISGSPGICLFPDDGDDARTLLKRADMAMYEAKRAGKNTWRNWTGFPCSSRG